MAFQQEFTDFLLPLIFYSLMSSFVPCSQLICLVISFWAHLTHNFHVLQCPNPGIIYYVSGLDVSPVPWPQFDAARPV